MATKIDKQRAWVNTNFGNLTRGSHMSNSKKRSLLKKLWKQAKRDIK